MPNTRCANFQNFPTERFTAVAVEVFEEVGNILEDYQEENTPEEDNSDDPIIKLTRIGLPPLC